MRWAMTIFYLAAGVIHLQSPDAFLPIMPDWVPAPREIILFTGACEIAGALGLLTRSFRWWAAVMLALYAACVFPANVKHAFENVQLPQLPSSWWYHGPRLALQPVIIWWALYCGQVISWPFRRGLGCLVAISGKGAQNLLRPPSAHIVRELPTLQLRARSGRSVHRPCRGSGSNAYQQAPELPPDEGEIAIL